jgi:mannosidase alpha-like ER degradation enhancer 2
MVNKKLLPLFYVSMFLIYGSMYAQVQIDITNLDGTVSAQYSDSPDNEGISNIIDKNPQTKFLTFHNKSWVQYSSPAPYIVTSYAITSANDSPERDPNIWLLLASDDNISWDTLDVRENEEFPSRFERKSYTFENAAAYSYFRFVITSYGSGLLQLSELEIFGTPESGLPDPVDITNFGGSAAAQYNDMSSASALIDNSFGTAYTTANASAWVQYKTEKPYTYNVTGYALAAADGLASNNPKDWVFKGSNDNLTWTNLDERTGQSLPAAPGLLKFEFPNGKKFRYYRLDISANNGGSALSIGELRIYGAKGDSVNYPNADFSSSYSTILAGDSVAFINSSDDGLSYSWSFPGGNPSSSSDKNPVVAYNTPGKFDVSLKVFNSSDTDFISRSAYINVEVIDKDSMAAQVKQEFLLCWNAYKKYAWGYDELSPLSKSASNWYDETFYMTAIDAFDTILLMGLDEEAALVHDLAVNHLSFDKDVYVSHFEFTIRLLGGLISSYQITGDTLLLNKAKELADRSLPVFNSTTGMTYGDINLKTGAVRRSVNNPAEIGTLLIEYGALSGLTGDSKYFNKAKKALQFLYKRRSSIGLVGSGIDINSGAWESTDSHIAGGIDSYIEYLLKAAILFNDADCRDMWNNSIEAVNKYLADSTETGLWYGHADMKTGIRTSTTYGSLDAFFPAVLALGGDMQRAAALQESGFKMWNRYGIEPESFNYVTMTANSAGYYLRPEIIESAYYLYKYTKDPHYLLMAKVFFDDLKKHCRTEDGYVSLSSVITKQKSDGMPSYFLAETMKYMYLIFAPDETLDFENVIFNTEAHPIKNTWGEIGITPPESDMIPKEFKLYNNYPNPFNPETVIYFDLPEQSQVKLKVYNIQGQLIATLMNGKMNAGSHSINFAPKGLASGVYIYRLETGKFSAAKKMLFLK